MDQADITGGADLGEATEGSEGEERAKGDDIGVAYDGPDEAGEAVVRTRSVARSRLKLKCAYVGGTHLHRRRALLVRVAHTTECHSSHVLRTLAPGDQALDLVALLAAERLDLLRDGLAALQYRRAPGPPCCPEVPPLRPFFSFSSRSFLPFSLRSSRSRCLRSSRSRSSPIPPCPVSLALSLSSSPTAADSFGASRLAIATNPDACVHAKRERERVRRNQRSRAHKQADLGDGVG
jgi:hypothetical protein